MWKNLGLRTRIFVILAALVLTTIGGGLVTLWRNESMDALISSLIDKNVASNQAAEELETALLQQKGYLTYYFLDGNPKWLAEIQKYNRPLKLYLGTPPLCAQALPGQLQSGKPFCGLYKL